MRCSVTDCTNDAVAWLRFAGMGDLLHVHVCPPHEMIDREFADVIDSGELPCPDRLHCADPVGIATPPLIPGG